MLVLHFARRPWRHRQGDGLIDCGGQLCGQQGATVFAFFDELF